MNQEAGESADFSTPAERRWYLRFPRSQRVKEREAPENVEARLVTGTDFLGHTLQYGHMRSHFRSWRGSGRLQRNLRVPTRSRSVGSHSLQGFYRSAARCDRASSCGRAQRRATEGGRVCPRPSWAGQDNSRLLGCIPQVRGNRLKVESS